jgi:hypothetical protein
LLPVTTALYNIATFDSATNIDMVKVTTKIDTICITDSVLEDNFLLTTMLSNPENKSVAKDVAQKIQKFYFRDKSNNTAVFSSAAEVRKNFLFCSHSTKFSMSIHFGSFMVKERLRSTVQDSRILRGIYKLQEAYEEMDGEN